MKSLYIGLAFLLFSCNSHNQQDKLVELIKILQQNRPEFSVQDAYKLLYQSEFGVAHILDDSGKAKKYLQYEFDAVNASEEEVLFEPISLDSEIVRINLRPFKAQHRGIDTLFQVMVISAREIKGTLPAFKMIWNDFKNAVNKGRLDFNREKLLEFDKEIKAGNYPAVHHSDKYKAAYKPAYRVVKKQVFDELFFK